MPRQSRASRPASRPAPPPQARGAHSMAAPPAAQRSGPMAAPAPTSAAAGQGQGKQPGMLAQMAATAGSVAVGSTIGHGISSMFFGGRSAEAQDAPPAAAQQQTMQGPGACDLQTKEFTKCLETNDVNACSWYLEQLKACQAAARPY